MIDKRKIKSLNEEIDGHLKNLSDTEIMLEFSSLLSSIYPHLVKTHNHCYDPFDDISENLFFNFVHATFSGKYGTVIDMQETHKYGFSLHCYRNINHISIVPKSFPLTCDSLQEQVIFSDKQELDGQEFIFSLFGDKQNNLSGGIDQVDIKNVNFDFVNFAIVDKISGLNVRDQSTYWIDKNLVHFELVLEDFDKV